MIVVPRPGMPRAPKFLGPVGRRLWRDVWRFAAPWLSEASNVEIVGRLCRAYEEYYDLLDKLAKTSILTKGSMGQPLVNPLWHMKELVEQRITRYESLCGLTPSDMQRFYASLKEEHPVVDPLDELRTRRSG